MKYFQQGCPFQRHEPPNFPHYCGLNINSDTNPTPGPFNPRTMRALTEKELSDYCRSNPSGCWKFVTRIIPRPKTYKVPTPP